jgi:hypothetical protein
MSKKPSILSRWIYQFKNWRAHLRAWILGTENGVGLLRMTAQLAATVIRADGTRLELGVVSRRVVTTAGVNFIRDDFNGGTTDITTMNFHDSGTGSVAEAIGDTDLGTPAGPTTRATGTQTAPASKQYRTTGTITYAGTLAITEHGVFNQATRGGGSTLLDRSVFTAINVVSGDSIQFQYTLTINDGG